MLLAVGLGYIFAKTFRMQSEPLPGVLKVELVLVGAMFATVGRLLISRLLRTWKTAYAVTDRRLLMAVGPGRHGIQEVPLDQLDPVKSEYRPKVGKVLVFSRRGGESLPVWPVRDVEGVRKLIEAARTAAQPTAA